MNAIDVLRERLKHNLAGFRQKWLEMSKEKLIDNAYEIYAVQSVYRELPRLVSEKDAEVLLKYENPLDVVTDIFTMGDVANDDDLISEFGADYQRTIDKIRSFNDKDIEEIGFAVAS